MAKHPCSHWSKTRRKQMNDTDIARRVVALREARDQGMISMTAEEIVALRGSVFRRKLRETTVPLSLHEATIQRLFVKDDADNALQVAVSAMNTARQIAEKAH